MSLTVSPFSEHLDDGIIMGIPILELPLKFLEDMVASFLSWTAHPGGFKRIVSHM